MTLTPEEKVNQEIWKVLQDIKEESLVSEKDGTFFYDTTHTVIGGGVSVTQERKWTIVRKLAREQAVAVIREVEPDWRGTRNGLYLKVLHPKFDEVYGKYQKACDLKSYLNDYQEKLYEGEKSLPEFSEVDNSTDKETALWLNRKDKNVLQKIWLVVSVLSSEWQLRDKDTFKIPIDKFVKDWVDNESELEGILSNLHNRTIIEVSRKLGETPHTDEKDKPQGSVWATINDDPTIIRKEDTLIRIFPKKFNSLVSKLGDMVVSDTEDKKETQPKVDFIDTASRKGYEKKWDVLQAIWDVYESHSRPDSLLVPVARLVIKGRDEELIDGIIDGFKKEGLFQKWDRKDRWYDLESINHETLSKVYREVGNAYKERAVAYQQVRKEDKDSKVFACGSMQLNLNQGTIQYKDNSSIEISPDNRIVKFLVLLMESKKVMEYAEIAKSLEMNCWHEGVTNKDVAREVQFLRRDLANFLRDKVGMTNKEIEEKIISKKNVGYKLYCES